jgi:hypothetical protein
MSKFALARRCGCSPGTTIGIGVGIELLDVTDRSAFATLAGHLDPYDHPR